MNKKVYVVGGNTSYSRFMDDVELVDKMSDADVVLFTGGEDVDPSLYGCAKHPSTNSNIQRDYKEREVFKKISPKQLAVGICRGSQFLCVMNGGKLVQDLDGHALWMTHPIVSPDSRMVYEITSTHHQLQYPYDLNPEWYKVLYTAYQASRYEGEGIDNYILNRKHEPEVVLYSRPNLPKCLAIQGHPEMIPDSPVSKMLDSLISEYLTVIKTQ